MAETAPTMSGGQGGDAKEDPSIELSKMGAQTDDKSIPSVPAKDEPSASTTSAEPSAPQEAASSSKGKEKETTTTGPSTADIIAPPPPAVLRQDRQDSLSIGPSDAPHDTAGVGSDGVLVCNITLLLPTGARHPYRIDERYLSKRNVDVPDLTEDGKKDPFSISVYKLKELILREWREEWDGKPASPSSIRLIHFGKLLDDKEQLKKYQFSAEAPNVVHMSVRPAEMLEEDEAAKGKSSGREGRNREGGGGCCVIL